MTKTRTIRKANEADVRYVADRISARHLAEISALTFLEGRAVTDALPGRFTGGTCAVLDGEPVAVGEVFQSRPNVVSLGLIATDRFPEVTLGFTRYLRDGLFAALRASGVHRIECVTMAEFEAAHRWLRLLGLEKEADLRAYGRGGEDFAQFAWVA